MEPHADVPGQITLSQCGGGEESDPPVAAEKRHCPLLLPYRLQEEIKPRLCQDDCDSCLSGPSVEQLMFAVLLCVASNRKHSLLKVPCWLQLTELTYSEKYYVTSST